MPSRKHKQKTFFQVGHRVQLHPKSHILGVSWDGQYATIRRIEQRPASDFFEDPDDWYDVPHQTLFWLNMDDYSELGEIPFSFQELKPLQPKLSKQQLVAYCKQCMGTERNEDRWNAYLYLTRYLNGEWAGPFVGTVNRFLNPHDIINVLITWSTEIWKQAVTIRENNHDFADKYEVQAQVYDELRELLMPARISA